MFKFIALTCVTLAIAIGGGAASVWLALDSDFDFGSIRIGAWVAHPARGTPDADPYARARFSREADLALGHAEGLTFLAYTDEAGDHLDFDCRYVIQDGLPPARFWTLHARDSSGHVSRLSGARPAGLHSLALLRERNNTVTTMVSRQPAPGNWLAIDGKGEFFLVLTLYDTAITSSSRIADVELPRVTKVSCDG